MRLNSRRSRNLLTIAATIVTAAVLPSPASALVVGDLPTGGIDVQDLQPYGTNNQLTITVAAAKLGMVSIAEANGTAITVTSPRCWRTSSTTVWCSISPTDQVFVDGNPGNDTINLINKAPEQGRKIFAKGGSGDDAIYGSAASDRISPGYGSDYVSGGGGDDFIWAHDNYTDNRESKKDTVGCGIGIDEIWTDEFDSVWDCENVSFYGLT